VTKEWGGETKVWLRDSLCPHARRRTGCALAANLTLTLTLALTLALTLTLTLALALRHRW
jgi:hypothetical protein